MLYEPNAVNMPKMIRTTKGITLSVIPATASPRPEEDFLATIPSYYAYAILGIIIEGVNEVFKHSPCYMAELLLEINITRPRCL